MNRRKKNAGFTLIELLIVIAIIAVLLAVLMPALQRVKHQAKAVGCQSNLKQWGVIFIMYANDNEGRFPNWVETNEPWPNVLKALWPYHRDTNDLFLCPVAAKPQPERLVLGGWRLGGTIVPWSLYNAATDVRLDCSYGLNIWGQYVPESGSGGAQSSWYWQTIPAGGANSVPVVLDSVYWWAAQSTTAGPPEREELWTTSSLPCCLNRHHGSVVGVFADWSARKVGLKELWTLKWHREFDTAGPWTTAGGVQAGDWPQWMRKFRDY